MASDTDAELGKRIAAALAGLEKNDYVCVAPYLEMVADMTDACAQRLLRVVLVNARKSGVVSMDRKELTVDSIEQCRDLQICTLMSLSHFGSL